MDLIGWIAVGLFAAVTGELVLPGRNPGGIVVTLLVGAAGSLLGRFVVGLLGGAGATKFSVASILWATLGSLALLAIYRLAASLRDT
jgi:uncharacterized membrane protein YeaQ/YmgE (transglycosylase-associated protein family)